MTVAADLLWLLWPVWRGLGLRTFSSYSYKGPGGILQEGCLILFQIFIFYWQERQFIERDCLARLRWAVGDLNVYPVSRR
jgi:hypothetical protein